MNMTTDLIAGLENRMLDNDGKINAAEGISQELNAALEAKFPALDLTKHRFTHRTGGRPGKELVGDAVHQALRNEYTTLDTAAQALVDRIKKVSLEIQHLQESQEKLRLDVEDKKSHLAIDEEIYNSTQSKYPAYWVVMSTC